MKLSVVIPCYNEASSLEGLIQSVLQVDLPDIETEILLVDDGSTDGSWQIAQRLAEFQPEISLLRHEKNQGKGAALRTAFAQVQGDIVVIQDADLEYDPNEYPKLLAPILSGRADVVFGSRFRTGDSSRVLYFWHSVANRLLTTFSNIFTQINLTDMETCYKMFRSEVLQKIQLKESRFGVEPEITAKVAHLPGVRIYEVGISYHGRTYAEGKKIGWRDAIRAVYAIIKYNWMR